MTAGVTEVVWCQWCRSHVDAPHDCPYSTPCPTEANNPCGICGCCLAAQQSDPRYSD